MKKQQARIKTSGGSLNFIVDNTHAPAKSTSVSQQSPEVSVMSPVAAVNLPVTPQVNLPVYVPTSLLDNIRNISSHSEISMAL